MANPTPGQLRILLTVESGEGYLADANPEDVQICDDAGWIEQIAGRGYCLSEDGRDILKMIRPAAPSGVL